MSLLDKLSEVRDRAEEAIDRRQVHQEVEASAGRIAEGRKAYREQQEQNARETEASADRIESHRKIKEQEQKGEISPELAEKRRVRAAANYDSQKYSNRQKMQQRLQGAKEAILQGMSRPAPTRPARPAPKKVQPQPTARQVTHDPLAFWGVAPKQAPAKKGKRVAAPQRPQSILASEMSFLQVSPKGKRKKGSNFWL